MSCRKKCCIPPYFFLLNNLNFGNIRGSFVAVLRELNANNQTANTITAQGQLVGTATNTNISLASANVSVTSSNGNTIGNFSLFLTGTNNTQVTLGVSYSDITSNFIDSHVVANNPLNITGSTTLTANSAAFTRVPTGTINYDYTITVTLF